MFERRDPFQAIADPTRRNIIHILSEKPINVKSIAEHFDISRPAISKHLRILEECGLIRVIQDGRERYCHAQLAQLQLVAEWVDQYRNFWNQRLNKLEALLNEEVKNENQKNS